MKISLYSFKHLIIAVAMLLLLASGATIAHVLKIADQVVDSAVIENPKISILDRYSLEIEGARIPVKLSAVPPLVWQAFISAEDRSFFHHWGFSPSGILRALFRNIWGGRYREGGSTITQQVIKLRFLGSKKTIARKIKELVYAFSLEQKISKERILEMYLNELYFGSGYYGLREAALGYFAKRPKNLSLRETSILAAMIKAPANYDLDTEKGLKRALDRADYVLRRMYEDGFITGKQARTARRQRLQLTTRKVNVFRDSIRYVMSKPGVKLVQNKTIKTTLDRKFILQLADKVELLKPRLAANQLAVVAVDLQTAGLRAIIGSKDQSLSEFNRAVHTQRPIGKMILPIITAIALEQGIGLGERIDRSPFRFFELIAKNSPYEYSPLLAQIGLGTLREYWKHLRIEQDVTDFSVLLGRIKLSLLDLVKLYFSLYQGGALDRVHTFYGEEVTTNKKVFRPATMLALSLAKSSLQPEGYIQFESYTSKNYWMVTRWRDCLLGIWVGSENGKGHVPKEVPMMIQKEFLSKDSTIAQKAKFNLHFHWFKGLNLGREVFLPHIAQGTGALLPARF